MTARAVGARGSRVLAIINPHSAGGRTARRRQKLESALATALPGLDIAVTTSCGHAISLAAQAREMALVVAVGGDGTIHEVVNGLMAQPAASRPALGVVMTGTGSDFRRSHGLPAGYEAQIDLLQCHQTHAQWLDIGEISFTDFEGRPAQRFFANVASMGLSGTVARFVNRGWLRRWVGGQAAFAAASVRGLMRSKNADVLLTLGDQQYELSTQLIAVALGQYFGGGMMVAPRAIVGDGLFDVVALHGLSRLGAIWNFPRVYRGTHLRHPKVRNWRATTLQARSDQIVPIEIDGESLGTLPACFKLYPAAIQLVGVA